MMFDRYYCIKTFCDTRKHDNFKENALENSNIRRLNFREKDTFTACVLIAPLPGHKNITFDVTNLGLLLCIFLILTLDFVMALECVLRKPRSRLTTAREFPC